MTLYSLTFATPAISGPDDDRLTALESRADVVAASHGGLTTVTILVEGRTADRAAAEAMRMLDDEGIDVTRLVPDLVNRSDIAERLGITRQTVGHWVRGDRKASDPFPPPYAGDIWLWGDLLPWLSRNGHPDRLASPDQREHAIIDGRLTVTRDSPPATGLADIA